MGFFTAIKQTFRHGIHPPEHKDATRDLPIRQFPFAPEIHLPIQQNIGAPPHLVVREGQDVRRGELLAKADGWMSVSLHAPVTGTIRKITNIPSISGRMTPGIIIQTQPSSSQQVMNSEGISPEDSSPDQILQAIQQAGIVGLGGAAFPTHVKLKVPENKKCEVLLINGIECEPFLTTDHRVMLEQAEDLAWGLRYLKKVTSAERIIIGIEANKENAAAHLGKHFQQNDDVEVVMVPVKYPQGSEKMLITSVLGMEVPSGGLPIDVGVVVVNVATTAEIGRLLPLGRGIQERVLTVTGSGIKKKGNYLVPIGTPLRFLLDYVEADKDLDQLFMGGPMMGVAIANLDISIVKGTSGIVGFAKEEVKPAGEIYPCIRCGACVDACPIFLNPSQLGLLAKAREYGTMASDFNLMDCFECGSCSFVCPSHIPLVQYFRTAKSHVRKQRSLETRI